MGQQAVSTVGTDRRRAGRHARRRLRGEAWRAIRRNPRIVVGVLATYLVAAAVQVAIAVVFEMPSWQMPFLVGLMLGSLPALWMTFTSAMGLAPRWLGADAERWTADALRKLPERSWAVFHDVYLGGVNVDHVAVGSGRVYAIETKWTSSDLPEHIVKRFAGQASHRAGALERALATQGVRRQVVPLLVLWGPAAWRRFGKGPVLASGTRVVAGHASKDWLGRMQAAAPNGAIDYPVRQALRRLIELGEATGTAEESSA